MASAKNVKEQISLLAKLVEMANKAAHNRRRGDPFGKCEWTDVEGNQRCNSPWSQFQCEQAGGVFTPDTECDENKR